jgi:PTS system nitrogen regulatory IIA component
MQIMDFLNPKAISTDLKATDKKGIIKELLDLLINSGDISASDKSAFLDVIIEREALGSTGIGLGVGIPHGKSQHVKNLVASFGISRKGVNFDSLDGEPAHIFFLLLAPQDTAGPHLKALARISRLLKEKYFRDALKKAADPKEALKIIKEEDSKK